MIPYKADVMMQRYPWANWSIIGVTAIVSLMALYHGPLSNAAPGMGLWCYDAKGVAADILREKKLYGVDLSGLPEFHSYQLVTHAFLHSGLLHLFGNMLFLFVFGNAVNAKVGQWQYVALYLGFAVITGLAWFLFPSGGLHMIGASGATMGVAGMFVVLYPLNEISIFMFIFLRPTVYELSAVWFLLLYFVLDFLGFLSGADNVAHISHMTGMGVGAALTSILVLSGLTRPSPGEKTLLEVFGVKVKGERREKPLPLTPPQIFPYRMPPGVAMPPERPAGEPKHPAGPGPGRGPKPT